MPEGLKQCRHELAPCQVTSSAKKDQIETHDVVGKLKTENDQKVTVTKFHKFVKL